MSEELKSAWEIALEKMEAQGGMEAEKLSEEQKSAIAEIRKQHQAGVAEAEISTQSHLRKALESGAMDEVEKMRQRLLLDKERLHNDMEKKIEKIRKSGSK